MKKIFLILTSLVTLTTSTLSSLLSCSSKTQLKIIFTPSRDKSKLLKTVKELEVLLEEKLKSKIKNFNMKVKTIVGTDYASVGEALKSGTADISFLPSSTYRKSRGKKNDDNSYDAAAVLLLPARHSISADYNVFKEDINTNWSSPISAFNSWRIACEYKKELIDIKNHEDAVAKLYKKNYDSPYYRSVIYANKEFLSLNKFDFVNIKNEKEYCTMMKQIINKAVDNEKLWLGSKTSSGGTIYPLNWMKNTLNFTEQELKNVIKKMHQYNEYTDAIGKLATADAHISAGYGDMRIDCAVTNTIKQVFENVEVIGVTEGIATDAIQYSRKTLGNNYNLIKYLRSSFCELIKDDNYRYIFDNVYGHKHYCKPDLDDEKSSRKWEIQQDEIYTKIDSTENDILKLLMKFTT